MDSWALVFPDDFDDYASELVPKGWFGGARLVVSGREHALTFCDPVRLQQEIEDELRTGHVFFEPNLIVVPSVTREHMVQAVERLMPHIVDSLLGKRPPA